MKTYIMLAIGVLFFGLSSSAAHADWNYVKWGMTKQEAIKASSGEARPLQSNENPFCRNSEKPVAVIPSKQIAGLAFEVAFCSVGDGKITSVILQIPSSSNAYVLLDKLIAEYGKPVSQENFRNLGIIGESFKWNDAKSGNTIGYLYQMKDGGVHGNIDYRKLGGSGL